MGRLAFSLVVTALLGACAMSESHFENEPPVTGGDMRIGVDAGVVDEAPAPVEDPASPGTCGTSGAAPGRLEVRLGSLEIWDDLPVSLPLGCVASAEGTHLAAADGLFTVQLWVAPPEASRATGFGELAFESLATFAGGCSVCVEPGGGAGTVSCPTLVWRTEDDALKASLAGAFRCAE